MTYKFSQSAPPIGKYRNIKSDNLNGSRGVSQS